MKCIFKILTCLCCCLGISDFAQGQDRNWSNLRQKWVKTDTPTLLDSLSVSPESIKVNSTDSLLNYTYDINTGIISFSDIAHQVDSVLISYRVFPFNFTKKYARHTPVKLSIEQREQERLAKSNQQEQDIALEEKKEELFESGALQKSGSLSRGVSFGNKQDVFVNSALNLQLKGKLSEDIEITAVISDQNVPFQPEGNTQQLQDFDKIHVQLKHKLATLDAGDIQLKNDSSYFLKYNKNVQGGAATVRLGNDSTRLQSETKIGVSIAKGQFRSSNITPVEGVSGPYRIQGPATEPYIIVIAGSEKVFVDGKLLKRGFNEDYVIDYNRAELTFTNKILITQYTRIRIDFEYAVQQYSRNIFQASHKQRVGKFESFFNFYKEGDDKDSPLLFTLSDEEKLLLSNAGNDPNKTWTSAVTPASSYDPSRVMYTIASTTMEDTVFVKATPEDTPLYTITFTDVGLGNGNYILDEITPVGRSYKWVDPIDGVKQGSYAPIKRLIPPTQKQMVAIGASYQLSQYEKVFVEGAFSDHDKNLFSDKGNAENQGQAIKFGLKSKDRALTANSQWKWSAYMDMEYDEEGFQSIDRFRTIEFDRNWGLNQNTDTVSEQIINGGFELYTDKKHLFKYDISQRKRGNLSEGLQHKAKWESQWKHLKVKTSAFLMDNNTLTEVIEWRKLSADISVPNGHIIPGYKYAEDRNTITQTASEQVVSSLMNYNEHKFYINSGDSLDWTFHTFYSIRNDRTPQNGLLKDATEARTFSVNAGHLTSKSNLRVQLTYRELEHLNDTLQTENTLMGRIDWRKDFWQKNIRSNLTFTTSTSRELKREFIFVRVDNGMGTHTWRDLNGDGIQDLNEFFIAINADERDYAKFFTPTNEYIPAYQTALNYKLNLKFPSHWKKKKGVLKQISKLSNQFAFLSDQKITSSDWTDRFLLFGNNLSEDNILANKSTFKNTVFYNKSGIKFSMQYQYLNSNRKQLLTNGIEERQQEEHNALLRWNWTKGWDIEVKGTEKEMQNLSNFMEDRNYTIQQKEVYPKVTWQPNYKFRLSMGGGLKQKYSPDSFNEQSHTLESTFKEISLGFKHANASKHTLMMEAKWITIDYNGDSNASVSYEMLEALQMGKNYTWNVNYIQKLSNGLQLQVGYNGRKSPEQPTAHVGRMQVTALF